MDQQDKRNALDIAIYFARSYRSNDRAIMKIQMAC